MFGKYVGKRTEVNWIYEGLYMKKLINVLLYLKYIQPAYEYLDSTIMLNSL